MTDNVAVNIEPAIAVECAYRASLKLSITKGGDRNNAEFFTLQTILEADLRLDVEGCSAFELMVMKLP